MSVTNPQIFPKRPGAGVGWGRRFEIGAESWGPPTPNFYL